MSDEGRGFQKDYSEDGFWKKVGKYAIVAGKEVLERSMQLYYSAQSPNTPRWAKTVIYGALGYFIVPADAIPDLTPVVGYSDDLGVLTAAIATVVVYITPEVKEQARKKVREWFGD
jgi:uncharacterized membrane protein YkvA (DUF1232 family)